jgi:hypothetical protein
MFAKTLETPELEYAVNKSIDATIATIEFQGDILTKSLEFFNQVTDKMFYTYTVKAAETINTATENAKENISKLKTYNVFGSGKTK